MECKQIGTDFIIAPMVETDYALLKFIDAKNKIFDKEDRKYTNFLINIETKTTTDNLDKIIKKNNFYPDEEKINGWVFGRVDYSLSSGVKRELINENKSVINAILEVFKKQENNLDLVVGGAISVDAINFEKY